MLCYEVCRSEFTSLIRLQSLEGNGLNCEPFQTAVRSNFGLINSKVFGIRTLLPDAAATRNRSSASSPKTQTSRKAVNRPPTEDAGTFWRQGAKTKVKAEKEKQHLSGDDLSDPQGTYRADVEVRLPLTFIANQIKCLILESSRFAWLGWTR